MNKIQKARVAKGWTQEELAEKLGVSDGAVSQWELGNFKPRRETRIKIEQILFNGAKSKSLNRKSFTVGMGYNTRFGEQGKIFLGFYKNGEKMQYWLEPETANKVRDNKENGISFRAQGQIALEQCGGHLNPKLVKEYLNRMKSLGKNK